MTATVLGVDAMQGAASGVRMVTFMIIQQIRIPSRMPSVASWPELAEKTIKINVKRMKRSAPMNNEACARGERQRQKSG